MKRSLVFLAGIFFLIVFASGVLAIPSLDIDITTRQKTVVVGVGNPAMFDLIINNTGADDVFNIYTLVGVAIEPPESFELAAGEEKTLMISALPSVGILEQRRGLLSFEYQVKGRDSGILKDILQIEIKTLDEVVSAEFESLSLEDTQAVLFLRNTEDILLENLSVSMESEFFSYADVISLGAFEEREIVVELDERPATISAGSYLVSTAFEIVGSGQRSEVEGLIDFAEQEGVASSESTDGFIVRTTRVEKENVGNTPVTVEVEISKDVVARLFTSNSPSPVRTERMGLGVTYFWEEEVGPGESFVVEAKTNYTVPFVLLILIIVVAIVVRAYSRKAVSLKKSVSFVRTKGGEFALKVRVHAKARKDVEGVVLSDFLPGMTKLYEKFGKKPDKIDAGSRRLVWELGAMTKGESQVFSYIIYSKVNVIGRFELPSARASFKVDGKQDHAVSNRAFFAAEKD